MMAAVGVTTGAGEAALSVVSAEIAGPGTSDASVGSGLDPRNSCCTVV